VRRLLIGGSPDQGRIPASELNDGACPEKTVHLKYQIQLTENYFNNGKIRELRLLHVYESCSQSTRSQAKPPT